MCRKPYDPAFRFFCMPFNLSRSLSVHFYRVISRDIATEVDTSFLRNFGRRALFCGRQAALIIRAEGSRIWSQDREF